MKQLLSTTLAAFMFAHPAHAASPAQKDLLAPLDRFVAAFNRWDAELPDNAFTEDCTVLDIFPPFQWTGPGSVRVWWDDLAGADSQEHARKAMLHEHIVRGQPQAISTTALSANFNVPAVLTYVRNGTQHEIRGRWVINEKLTPAGWRISAHAWATIESR